MHESLNSVSQALHALCMVFFGALTRLIGRHGGINWPLVYNDVPLAMRAKCQA